MRDEDDNVNEDLDDMDPMEIEGIEIVSDEEIAIIEAEEEEAKALAREANIERMVEGEYDRLVARDRARALYRRMREDEEFDPVAESVGDIMNGDFTDLWYIDGFVPQDGKFLMVAQAKGGKTTCVTNVVRSLAERQPFLGKFPVQSDHPLRIAVIDNEMSPGLLKEWYIRLDLSEEAQENIHIFRLLGHASSFNPTDPENRARWVDLLEPYDIVIVDCLSPFIVAAGLDENHEAGKWLEGLDELMADAGVFSYGVVHHTGHEGERSRGDSRILGWATQTIQLVVEENGPDDMNPNRFIKSLSGRGEPIPLGALDFDRDTGLLTYRGGVTRAKAKDERSTDEKRWDKRVPSLHAEYGYEGWFSVKDAEDVTGLGERATRELLTYGVKIKRLDRRKVGGRSGGGGWEYQIKPGIEFVEEDEPQQDR